MAAQEGWSVGPAPDPSASSAWTAGPAPAATFTTSNQKDASGNATVDPNTVGTYVRHLWEGLNPVNLGKLLPFPKAAGGSGVDNPFNPVKVKDDMYRVKLEADAAWAKGDKVLAAEKYIESVVPLLGPMMAHWGNQLQAGKYAAAAGDMTAFTVASAAPAALSEAGTAMTGVQPSAPAVGSLTAEEAAANAFGESRGVPLDAATKTGNPFVRGVQKVSGESMLGAPPIAQARAAQAGALQRVGGELADVTHPVPVTAEQAGTGVAGSIRQVMSDLRDQANNAYGKLRDFEKSAAPDIVPKRGETAASEPMQLAVNLSDVKTALKPTFDRLSRENQVAPLMGGKAEALRALDRVLNGPDHVSLSTAEDALGDLKSMARADEPLLRTAGQGVAAKAVRELSDAVTQRAAAAGDEVVGALQEGRAASKAKYQAADVFDQLNTEPVKLFKQMTAPKDAAIGLLRKVQELAPAKMAEIGRAKLEEWLDLASERGRFDHADKLYAEWQKLGPETKRILFGKAANIDNLDKFFLLAKRIAENPNPSGTAPTLLKAGEMTGAVTHPLVSIPSSLTLGAVAKLLYSPRGVKALTRLLESDPTAPVRATGKAVGRAASQAAWIDVAAAAKALGVPLDVPKAADREGRP